MVNVMLFVSYLNVKTFLSLWVNFWPVWSLFYYLSCLYLNIFYLKLKIISSLPSRTLVHDPRSPAAPIERAQFWTAWGGRPGPGPYLWRRPDGSEKFCRPHVARKIGIVWFALALCFHWYWSKLTYGLLDPLRNIPIRDTFSTDIFTPLNQIY